MNNKVATFEGSKKLYKDLRGRLSEQAQQNFEAVKNLQELIKQESEKRSENDTVLRSLINTNTSDLRQEIKENIEYDCFLSDRDKPLIDEIVEIMAEVLELVIKEIKDIKSSYKDMNYENIKWPMIVFRSPKGWTGPREFDRKKIEGTFRAHQVPIPIDRDNIETLNLLES